VADRTNLLDPIYSWHELNPYKVDCTSCFE